MFCYELSDCIYMWLHNLIHQTQKRQKQQTPFRGQRQESFRNLVFLVVSL